MSMLAMVRHGQATLSGPDYDHLSPLGFEQAERLGSYWIDEGLRPDAIFLGPCVRHRQTYETVAAPFERENIELPVPEKTSSLDEFPAVELMKRAVPIVADYDPEITRWFEEAKGDDVAARRAFQLAFQRISHLYATGSFEVEGLETFDEFRERVQHHLELIMQTCQKRKTAIAFTSGGPVAAALGWALDLSNEKVLELSWVIRNASIAEFLFTKDRFSLSTFNLHPYLDSDHLITYR